jgi:hypothetical protein
MKEIGGFFSLECGSASFYHKKGVFLNSARNALRYIIRTYNITEIALPYYTCPVVWQAVNEECCTIIPYNIRDDFLPDISLDKASYIVYNNYFGICGNNVEMLLKQYPHLIIDNAQAFYAQPKGFASFYSPRKFFGIPDGGVAVCDKTLSEKFNKSVSYNLCSHLLIRHDLSAFDGYNEFQKNDDALIRRPIELMSNLTKTLIGNINYRDAKAKRLKNFIFLNNKLKENNKIKIDMHAEDVPMVYPFRTTDETLRSKLIQNKIYVAKYWPIEDEFDCMKSEKAQNLANTIIPLPIDQRYDLDDMKRILEVIGV